MNALKSLRVRSPAVAGDFYPRDAAELVSTIDDLLSEARSTRFGRPRALICPHAGYQYSGKTAAEGFAQLQGESYDQVLLMGPSHRVAFRGVALADVDIFETPLGQVRVVPRLDHLAQTRPFLRANAPHQQEHALEVELPFLQRTLGEFSLLPLVFGDVDEEAVAQELSHRATPESLVIVSSDLSHYHAYDEACAIDRSTIDSILDLDAQTTRGVQACGRSPIATLLHLASWHKWEARLLGYQNSGDTAGDRARVVGYAAIGFYDTNS